MSLENLFRLSVIINMIDQVSKPAGKISEELTELEKRYQALEQASGRFAKTGTAVAMAGYAMTKGLMGTVEATYQTKSALGEVASLGVKDLKSLEKAATKFSNTFAGTTKADFISAAYDIKSGISSLSDSGVAEFTRLSALTGKATKSSVGDMTNLFAKGYGIYKSQYSEMNDFEFGEMFSGAVSKSVQQFRTKGSEMSAAISALGATASSANVPLQEQFVILGMLQQTMSGSESATKYKEFVKNAANAGKELGIGFLDANNQLLSMPQILDKLKGKYGDTVDAVEKMEIQKAFGTAEAVQVVDLLYNSVGSLRTNIDGMGDAMKTGTKLTTEMANAMDAGNPGANWQVMTQIIHNMAEVIGNSLAPAVTPLIEDISKMAESLSLWIEKHEVLAGGILKVVFWLSILLTVTGLFMGGIGVAGIAIAKISFGIGGFIKFLFMAKSGLETLCLYLLYGKDALFLLGGMLGRAAMSTWTFTVALLSNPITWVVIGVVALCAAIYLLYKNWDKVSTFLSTTWKSITEWVGKSIDSLVLKLEKFFSGIKGGWDKVKGLFNIGDTKVQVAAGGAGAVTPSKYLGTFATGIDYIPRDGWAHLHYGERVLTRNENAEFSRMKSISSRVKDFFSDTRQEKTTTHNSSPMYVEMNVQADNNTTARSLIDDIYEEAKRRRRRR